jgi:hypothetical protein
VLLTERDQRVVELLGLQEQLRQVEDDIEKTNTENLGQFILFL